MAAVVDEINRGTSADRVRSSINTSSAKTMEAIGALKIADMAPAEAQAINKVILR